MADEQIGEAVALLQFAQQIDDLRLHRHVERRGRLIEHEKARLQDERASDRDALALAAGKFVWLALGGRRVEPDLGERLLNELSPLRLAGAQIVDAQPLADDLRDR